MYFLYFAFILMNLNSALYRLSLLEMGDYKTTRLLDCCALDRIWSSTQRLEDLDWFGPGNALRPVWGVVFLLYCSRARVVKVQWGAYKLV